jgi:hypothetical protein
MNPEPSTGKAHHHELAANPESHGAVRDAQYVQIGMKLVEHAVQVAESSIALQRSERGQLAAATSGDV